MTKTHFKAIGMLVGMIFGAGIFALPYAVMKAGIFWGVFHFLIALGIMLFLHFWYGEVAYSTQGTYRFPGYVEKLLGERAKWGAFVITVFSYYGALLIYGILGGIFLSNFLASTPFIFSLLFFLSAGILIFLRFEKIAVINFYLSIALAGLVVYLFLIGFSRIEFANFVFRQPADSNWFLPYGVWLFALAGFAALPEARDLLRGLPFHNLKKIILISILLCAALYSIFVFTVVGVSGGNTTEDALAGLYAKLGPPAKLIGSILGFFAVFTSFIALGADLKNIFRYDFKISSFLSWLVVILPPFILFLLGAVNFVRILSIVGAIGLGLTGILIILMTKRLRERREENGKFRHLSWLVGGLTIVGVITALFFELRHIL